MASELQLLLLFPDGNAPPAEDIEYALGCDVLEYHEEES